MSNKGRNFPATSLKLGLEIVDKKDKKMKIRILALGLSLVVGLWGCVSCNPVGAQELGNASWGEIKTQLSEEPAGKLVVTKVPAAGVRNHRTSYKIELEPGSVKLPIFLHPGEDFVVEHRITAMNKDIKVLFFSTEMSASVVIFQCINRVSLFEGMTGIYLGATYPYGRELDHMAVAPFFLSEGWIVAAGTHRTLRVRYHISAECPVGVEITFILDNDLTQVVDESGRILSLDPRFDWSNAVTGTVVPAGCVDDTGYSPDGTPCFTYQR